jgi:hypothetical protein
MGEDLLAVSRTALSRSAQPTAALKIREKQLKARENRDAAWEALIKRGALGGNLRNAGCPRLRLGVRVLNGRLDVEGIDTDVINRVCPGGRAPPDSAVVRRFLDHRKTSVAVLQEKPMAATA